MAILGPRRLLPLAHQDVKGLSGRIKAWFHGSVSQQQSWTPSIQGPGSVRGLFRSDVETGARPAHCGSPGRGIAGESRARVEPQHSLTCLAFFRGCDGRCGKTHRMQVTRPGSRAKSVEASSNPVRTMGGNAMRATGYATQRAMATKPDMRRPPAPIPSPGKSGHK